MFSPKILGREELQKSLAPQKAPGRGPRKRQSESGRGDPLQTVRRNRQKQADAAESTRETGRTRVEREKHLRKVHDEDGSSQVLWLCDGKDQRRGAKSCMIARVDNVAVWTKPSQLRGCNRLINYNFSPELYTV